MKNSSIVSKISLWLINLTLLGVLIVSILISYKMYHFYSYQEVPTEGEAKWNSEVHLNIVEDFKLTKTLVYDVNSSPKLKEEFSLELSNPKIQNFQIDESEFEVNVRNDEKLSVEPIFDKLPMRIIIKDKTLKTKVLIGFTIINYLFLAGTFYWLWVLRQFIKSTVKQEFFTGKNSLRMVILSLPFLLEAVYENTYRNLSTSWFNRNFNLITGHYSTQISIDPMPIIFGLVFLIMAGVIYEGMKMKEENDLTV